MHVYILVILGNKVKVYLPSKSNSGMSKIKNLQIFRRHLGIKRKTFNLEKVKGRAHHSV